jgi:restriction system protein
MTNKIPQYHSFFDPILKALKALGGSGSIKEINDKIIGTLDLTNESLEKLHNPEEGNETEIEYRLAWACTYLKKYGLIDNSSRGVWALTKKAEAVHEVNPDEVVKTVREGSKKSRREESGLHENNDDAETDEQPWRVELHDIDQGVGTDDF